MRVPAFLAHWGPAGRSRMVPSMGFPTLPEYLSPLRPHYNALTSRIAEQISWQPLRRNRTSRRSLPSPTRTCGRSGCSMKRQTDREHYECRICSMVPT
jgi:hypothetical protein